MNKKKKKLFKIISIGIGVLLYDLRGRGESEGKGRALSNIDADIGGAVDYLQSRGYSAGDICIMGFCSGAASACIYASENSIGALILVGCFVDVQTMVVRQADSIGAPAFLAYLFWPGGMLFTRVLYGYHIVNPIDVIHNVACPILFMHEEYDEFTSSEETQRLFKAAGNPADEVWEVSYTKHSQTFKTHPQEFVEMVDKFLSAKTEGMPAE